MVEQVPFTDIYMDDATVDRVATVLRSGRYVKGPVLEEFENEFAGAIGTDQAIGVSNGTAALLLSMKAIGITNDDDVFVPAHTYFATVSPILEIGATPRFVDVDPERYTMDPELLETAIESAENPRAVTVTHMHGQPADINQILDIADQHDLAVIEDAAQAHLATYDGHPVGSFGDVGCFSFYPTKNMTVGGDGGMITTDDSDIADTCRALRNHGRDETGEHVVLGLNYRLDETNAAVGLEQLAHLPHWNKGRRRAAARYNRQLKTIDGITTPETYSDTKHVYHHYPVQVDDRETFREHLDDNGIDTGIHYVRAVHQQPAVENRVDDSPEAPCAEHLCERIVSLPMHPRLAVEEIDYVCNMIEGCFT